MGLGSGEWGYGSSFPRAEHSRVTKIRIRGAEKEKWDYEGGECTGERLEDSYVRYTI